MEFHSFADQCADSAAPAACKVWKRGKDKQRTLNRHVGIQPGLWVDRATFTWFSRGAQRELVTWRVVLKDASLSDDWQQYTPAALITIERMLVRWSAP